MTAPPQPANLTAIAIFGDAWPEKTKWDLALYLRQHYSRRDISPLTRALNVLGRHTARTYGSHDYTLGELAALAARERAGQISIDGYGRVAQATISRFFETPKLATPDEIDPLLTAAPALLAACRLAHYWLTERAGEPPTAAAVTQILTAITTATGHPHKKNPTSCNLAGGTGQGTALSRSKNRIPHLSGTGNGSH